jgi:two-component system response regulator YesN
MTIDKIVAFIDSNLKGHVYEYMVCKKPNLNIYCLINYDSSKSKEIKIMINNILSEVQQYLIGFEQYKVTIGIGPEITEFENIKKSIQESYRAAQNRIKLGTGRLIYSDLLHTDKQIHIKRHLDPYRDQYLMSIESLSGDIFVKTIHQVFEEFQRGDSIDFSVCYDMANELIDLFFGHITVQNNEGKQLKAFVKNACQHCYTLGHLTRLLEERLGKYLEACMKQLEIETAKPIRQAKQYISEHYSEKIILEDIAAIVDLNPVYFSVLFKKETGMNFSTYLVHIRMEIAKEMIRSSNKTIAAIADEVGYKDVRHFSQTFTKTVGVKPALYRKLYS